MFNKIWYKESIFKQFSIKFVLGFCIIILGFEISRLLYFISSKKMSGELFSGILILIGILFFIPAVFRNITEEKIAFFLFGLAFFLEGIIKTFMGHLYFPICIAWICLEIIGTIAFFLAYKRYTIGN